MERESEESRRLSIVFDNATGRLADAAAESRFEHLVSEAATAAVDHLARGYEVELVSREGTVLRSESGARHRQAILESLALVEPRPRQRTELRSRPVRPGLSRLADAALAFAARSRMTYAREKRLLLGLSALLAPLPLPFNQMLEWTVLVLFEVAVVAFLCCARHAARRVPTIRADGSRIAR